MDNKITKQRLSNLWAYDWIKMLVSIIAGILVWCLIFDTSAPRIRAGQDFDIFVYYSVNGEVYDVISEEYDDIGFSYDILDRNITTFTKDYVGTLMSTRASTYQGDILIIDSNTSVMEINEGENYYYGNYQSVVDGYSIYCIDDLINNALCYTANFTKKYNGTKVEDFDKEIDTFIADLVQQEIDYDLVYSAFKIRKKKDNAYKTAKQYADGTRKDIKRIEDTRDSAIRLYKTLTKIDEAYGGYLNNPLRANYTRYQLSYYNNKKDEEYKKVYEEGTPKTYGLNLCGIDEIELDGKRIVKQERRIGTAYNVPEKQDGSYEKGNVNSSGAEGVVLCVFDYTKKQKDLQYETLFFIDYILTTYTDLAEYNK